MTRTSGLLLGTVVLAAAGATAVTFGAAEPYVPRSTVPVPPPIALGGTFLLLFVAAVLNGIVNTRVWRTMGRDMGLTPEGGINVLAKHDLTGEVDGRSIRVHTYNRGSGGESGSSRTYTLVETELDAPLEWCAIVGPPDEDLTDIGRAGGSLPDIAPEEEALGDVQDLGGARTVAVRDEVAVWGDLPEEHADTLLTPRLKRAVTDVEGGVSVGDAAGKMIDAMSEMLEGAEGFGAGLAKGILDAAEGDRTDTPAATVTHERRGLVLDEETLRRRVEAVVAAADAAERVAAET